MRIALVTAAAAAFAAAGAGCSTADQRQSSRYTGSSGYPESNGWPQSSGSTDSGSSYTEPPSAVEEETVYCVDEQQTVVDDEFCDEAYDVPGKYLLWHSPGRHSYSPGSKVGAGSLVRADDAAGRARLGMPANGSVAGGTVARGGIGNSLAHGSSGG